MLYCPPRRKFPLRRGSTIQVVGIFCAPLATNVDLYSFDIASTTRTLTIAGGWRVAVCGQPTSSRFVPAAAGIVSQHLTPLHKGSWFCGHR